jgi:hypothetical protein
VVERSPEKAGVGGSTPSLATIFSKTCRTPGTQFHSISFQNLGVERFAPNENVSLSPARLSPDSPSLINICGLSCGLVNSRSEP